MAHLILTLTLFFVLSAFFVEFSYQITYCSGLTDFGDIIPRKVVISEGQTLLLSCNLNPELSGTINSSMISFTRTYEPVEMKYVKIANEMKAQLFLPNVTVKDAGDYRCLVNQSLVCISDVKVEYVPSSLPVKDFTCMSFKNHLVCSFTRNPSLEYKLVGTTEKGELFFCKYDSAEDEYRTTCDWSATSDKQKLPQFKNVNFTLTLFNRHGTHTQRYFFDGTDLVRENFYKKTIPANVSTPFHSPSTTESSKLPNEFNTVLVFAITLLLSFIVCIVIIFIIFIAYVKYSTAKVDFKTFKPSVFSENFNFRNNIDNHDQTFEEPIMLKTFSMFESGRNVDETEEHEYEEIYEYPQIRDSYQHLNEHNFENTLETSNSRKSSPELVESAEDISQPSSNLLSSTSNTPSTTSSPSPSFSTSSSSSQYVTHDQILEQNSQNLNSTVSKSTYVQWENTLVIATQLELDDSEEQDSLNIEPSVSERNDTYVTTQFLNKSYR